MDNSRNTKDKVREHLQSTFRQRTYQAALREGFFGKSCRRRWTLIPLPECHGVLTDQKFPGRLRGRRSANDRKAKKEEDMGEKDKQNKHAYDKVTAKEREKKIL